MPNDHPPSADELLKAWAAQRRQQAGGPFALPPDTRKRLEAEIDRVYLAAPPAPVRRAWFRSWWAWASTAAALLIVCFGLAWLLGFRSTGTSTHSLELAEARQSPAPVPLPTATPTSPPLQKQPSAESLPSTPLFVQQSFPPSRPTTPATSAPPPVAPTHPAPYPVLDRFHVEAADRGIQLVDADGSVYAGTVQFRVEAQPPAEAPPANATAQRFGLAAAREGTLPDRAATRIARRPNATALTGQPSTPTAPPPAQTPTRVRADADTAASPPALPGLSQLTFQAQGTNRTLNETVVIQGALVWTNQQTPAPTSLPESPNTLQQTLPLWLNNSVVRGQIQVGNQAQLELNAAPTPPRTPPQR